MEIKMRVPSEKTIKIKSKFNIGDVVKYIGWDGGNDILVTTIIAIYVKKDGIIEYKIAGSHNYFAEDTLSSFNL